MVIAWLSSYFHTPQAQWYMSLVKPEKMAGALLYDICEIIAYLFTALAMSKLIVKRIFGMPFVFILSAGILYVIFLACIFSLHNIRAGAVALAAVLALDILVILKTLFKEPLCALFYAPVFCWHIYLFCTTVFIALHN